MNFAQGLGAMVVGGMSNIEDLAACTAFRSSTLNKQEQILNFGHWAFCPAAYTSRMHTRPRLAKQPVIEEFDNDTELPLLNQRLPNIGA